MGAQQFFIAGMIDISSLIGGPNPSAGGTDTIFKYLKQVADYLGQGFKKTSLTTSSVDFVDVVNVSGAGLFHYAGAKAGAVQVTGAAIEVYIDGQKISGYSGNIALNTTRGTKAAFPWVGSGVDDWTSTIGDISTNRAIPFKNSLRVSIKADGTNELTGTVGYSIK